MKIRITLLMICLVIFASCKPTISGDDAQSFKVSKAKMEEKLSEAEKNNLEISLRVITAKAMKEKFNNPNDPMYAEKSFDEMVMAMTDGKTFSGIVSFAEDFLKKDRDENIARTASNIDSLKNVEEQLKTQDKALSMLKLTSLTITEEMGGSGKSPYLNYTFRNMSQSEILGYMIAQEISSKKTGKIFSSIQSGNRSELDESVKDGDGLKPGEEISMTEGLGDVEEGNEMLKQAQYPITDLSKLDFVVKVSPALIITRKQTFKVGEKTEAIAKKIKYLQAELKQLKEIKGTLAELELTK